ncbi:CheR family methyltransferase [Microvirga lenta]|uniref:CheR family methyltransferase n=1 Tax=Microvirga lenta TaxID=2881337 RepID=UPI001CFFA855|nr:protein-glutamate O-methyltransferase CheR [Microvirga lenta]MCB5175077.1 protein-glutamate O-methyltransferase CheR [Microvirga lenta]
MAARPAPGLPLDASFPRLKSLVIERTGHFYYQDKDDLLWERVRRRLQATGLRDCSQYLDLLRNPASGPVEWARLETEITIGETFFFRYAEQFAALRRTILPEIVERKRPERRLRIWSAGCATGAEPYSLAILVRQLLGGELENWRIGIVGTDINENFLATARQARFGKWALRSIPPEERAEYFLPMEREQWQLKPEFRSLVRFEKHNLLSLLDGTSPLQFTEFDLILCRNVLIYFHPETVNQVVGALRNCLLDDGWMLVGHAEPNPSFSAMMQAVSLPGTVAYRRRSGEYQAPDAPPEAPTQEPSVWLPKLPPPSSPPRPPDRGTRSSGPSPTKAVGAKAPARPAQPAGDILAAVRAKANAGELAAADALARKALVDEPLSVALHFYQGLISQAMKRPAEAEKAFRRCIYLDKSFAMAHYHLGLLLLADGRSGPGRRAMANAALIAGTLPDDHAITEGDGLTAKDLRNLIRVHLQAVTLAERRS